MIWKTTLYFVSLLSAVLALAPAMAHLLELPNKISLTREDYLTVQQIYHGWALLGFVIGAALFSTLALTIALRKDRPSFIFSLIALLCIIGAQVIFWTFTYPTNQATYNWTVLPENWIVLRRQWEYSHASGAVLNLSAVVALILAVLTRRATADETSPCSH